MVQAKPVYADWRRGACCLVRRWSSSSQRGRFSCVWDGAVTAMHLVEPHQRLKQVNCAVWRRRISSSSRSVFPTGCIALFAPLGVVGCIGGRLEQPVVVPFRLGKMQKLIHGFLCGRPRCCFCLQLLVSCARSSTNSCGCELFCAGCHKVLGVYGVPRQPNPLGVLSALTPYPWQQAPAIDDTDLHTCTTPTIAIVDYGICHQDCSQPDKVWQVGERYLVVTIHAPTCAGIRQMATQYS